MQNQVLDQNYQFFLDNRTKLLKKYTGQFVVINNEQVAGSYDDEQEAYTDALKKFGLGKFLIQKCIRKNEEPKAIFNSRVIFA